MQQSQRANILTSFYFIIRACLDFKARQL